MTADGEQPLGEVLLTATGELGYMIGAPHRRRGVAAQAVLLLRDYAHDAVGLAVLRLKIEADNPSSAAVAAKADFQLTGVAVDVVENKGRLHTVDVWEHATRQPDASG